MHVLPHILHTVHPDLECDQFGEFIWIDSLLHAERKAAVFEYAGYKYMQFELEETWERPKVRTLGCVDAKKNPIFPYE